MAYEIPQQLEYKEKIMFGLDFRQLAYAFGFSFIAFMCYKIIPIPSVKWILISIATLTGLSFMFLNLEQHFKDWKSFFTFREAFLMDEKLTNFIGVEKIENNLVYIKKKKATQRIAVIKVEPINFIIKNNKEKEALINSFQKFLNSLAFPIQIVMGTDSLNLDNYLRELEKRVEKTAKKTKNKNYEKLYESFKKHLNQIIEGTDMMDRLFYIVIPETKKDSIEIQTNVVKEKLDALNLKQKQLNNEELTQMLSRFFNNIQEEDDKAEYRKVKLTKDNITQYTIEPKYIKNNTNYLQINKTANRIVSAIGYPRSVEAGFLDKIITTNGDFDLSLHIEPFPIETMMLNLNKELQKQRADLYAQEQKSIINPSLEIKFKDTRAVLEELQKGNEKLFNISFYINCRAKSIAKLDLLTKKIESELNSVMIQPHVPLFRMSQGIKSVLPVCNNELGIKRNVTTSALSAFFPFTSQFLQIDNSGIWLGLNKNNIPIIKDIYNFTNPNGCILASSGAGKSYTAKLMIARHLLNGTRVIVIDPQSEYEELTKKFKGQLVTISKDSETIINPLDLMEHDYAEKRLALMDLLVVMLGDVSEIQKSVLDRALTRTYNKKEITNDPETWEKTPPILGDLLEELEQMSKTATIIEKETYRSLINRLSMYVDGVFSFLNRQTKINFDNHFVCFSIGDMPKQAKPVVMFLILDYVYLKMRKDRERKLLVIDEAWSLLGRAEEASYIFEIVKTCRKFNLGLLLITQDVADLLESKAGNALLANSSYTILMRQKPAVIDSVVKTFQLSQAEREKLLTANTGEGILMTENEHSEINIVASEEEDKVITTNPDQLLKLEKKKKIKKEKEVKIKINENKGLFRKANLKPEQIDFLLKKNYVISSHVPLGGGQRFDFLLKPRSNETAEHFFLIKAVESYLKEFTNKVDLYETKRPDIIFTVNGKKWAFEIETGSVIRKNPEKFFRKVANLKKNYGKNWLFVVTKSELCYTYSRYGKTYTRKNIERRIRSIFKNKTRPKPHPKKTTKNQAKKDTKKSNLSTIEPPTKSEILGEKMPLNNNQITTNGGKQNGKTTNRTKQNKDRTT